MKKLIILGVLISTSAVADSIPSIDEFAKSKELRNEYKSKCRGYSIFEKDKFPKVCFNWSKGSEKAIVNAPPPDFSSIKIEKKKSPNLTTVTDDVVSYLQAKCKMNKTEAKEAAKKSFRTTTLVSTFDRFGEQKYQEKLAQVKCSHFKPLF
ncbi:hypothetical protein [Thalassotalea euphylliae]|uniref:Uncharacterized protein n=1 Tax=Thalassotalea euphylliae TaxID=1655234 RepID=A0A3E0UCG6_9GAMM|nr:hypothetical protein [Thalassotalea euphylliae]REL34701.1 hypothetical protein DXX92_04640 [Thalassotalea euphylliae]